MSYRTRNLSEVQNIDNICGGQYKCNPRWPSHIFSEYTSSFWARSISLVTSLFLMRKDILVPDPANTVRYYGSRKKKLISNNLRGLKRSYSCSIICVGSPSSGPILWGAETSAVKGHAPYSPTAATLTHQISSTKKSPTTNCSLVTIMCGSSPSYTMCYFNLQGSEHPKCSTAKHARQTSPMKNLNGRTHVNWQARGTVGIQFAHIFVSAAVCLPHE